MTERTSSFGDVYTGLMLKAAEDNLDIVRAMCEDKATGTRYEIIGIDRGNKEVVPLFLVPIGGAQTILDDYNLLKEDASDVNPFTSTDATTH